MRAIALRYDMGYSVAEIAAIFGVHYNSVSRWYVKYRKGGVDALKRGRAPGVEPFLKPKDHKWLEWALVKPATKWGYSTPLWTVSMVHGLLRDRKGIRVHRVTIWRSLRRMGLTWQKPERRYAEQNKELVSFWVRKEWPEIQRWVKENRAILYFEDESGIALAPVMGKTWARKGKTPIVRVTGKRGGILAMSAVSSSGHLRFRLEKRRVNADVLIEFLEQILQSHKRRTVGIVMDQAPCHVAKKVRAYVEGQKRIEVFYIPPYSPELNPDEKVWRHLKHVQLKNRCARDKGELSKLILSALRSIQKRPELIDSFFGKNT